MVSILASQPFCAGFDSLLLLEEKIVNVAEVNQWCCLEESE